MKFHCQKTILAFICWARRIYPPCDSICVQGHRGWAGGDSGIEHGSLSMAATGENLLQAARGFFC